MPKPVIGKLLSVLLILFFTLGFYGKDHWYPDQPNSYNLVMAVYADTPESETKLRSTLASKGSSYLPGTHRLLKNGVHRFTYRLIFENSLYLPQHTHNPVDWNPRSEQAFAKARNEAKLFFLSVGYSNCQWRHMNILVPL